MIPDPLDRAEFQRLMISMGIWNSAWSTATRSERARILGRHHRRFMLQTDVGRRRLRDWIDAQRGRPIVVESYAARCRRIAGALRYFGDVEILPIVVDTLARLPRPVTAHVLDTCMVIVTGRSSNGWTTGGRLPALRPIVLAGDRVDDDIAQTMAHEVAHRFIGAEHAADVATAYAIAAEIRQVRDRVAAATNDHAAADRFVRDLNVLSELQANTLAIAWAARTP